MNQNFQDKACASKTLSDGRRRVKFESGKIRNFFTDGSNQSIRLLPEEEVRELGLEADLEKLKKEKGFKGEGNPPVYEIQNQKKGERGFRISYSTMAWGVVKRTNAITE